MGTTYQDIKADLLDRISRGDLPPGSLMPNEADLAQQFGCARATVNRAMRELADDGIIERKRKAGSRVRQAPVRQARFAIPIVRSEIESAGQRYGYALVSRAVVTAPDWLRAQLALDAGATVLHLGAMHFADDSPYQHEDRWINPRVVPDALDADFTQQGPNEWLVATIPLSTARIAMMAVSADQTLADHLGCAPGAALFRLERSTWLQDQAITLVRLTYRQGHRMTTQY